jgi:hypothetical protein
MLRPHRFVGRYAEVKVRRFGPLAVGGPWHRDDGKAYGVTFYAPGNWVWPIQWRRMNYPPPQSDTRILLTADGLSWAEPIDERRELPAPALILDRAYEAVRWTIANQPDADTIDVTIHPDGSLKSQAVGSPRDKRLVNVRVTVRGAIDEDARIWAQRRLGVAV